MEVAYKFSGAGTTADFQAVQCPGQTLKNWPLHTRADEIAQHYKNSAIAPWRHAQVNYKRSLWHDSFIIVAVSGLDEIAVAQAMHQPKYRPYLGIKSCTISLPMHPVVTSHLSHLEAIGDYSMDPTLTNLAQRSRRIRIEETWLREGLAKNLGIDCREPIQERYTMPTKLPRQFDSERWRMAAAQEFADDFYEDANK